MLGQVAGSWVGLKMRFKSVPIRAAFNKPRPLVRRQHGVCLAAVALDDDDGAIADSESGNLGTLSVKGEGRGMVATVSGSPTLIGGAADPLNGAGLMYSRISRVSSGERTSPVGVGRFSEGVLPVSAELGIGGWFFCSASP